MIYIYVFILESIHKIGIEKTREIVYGKNYHNEIVGMSKFINSRQSWCKRNILKTLKGE
jgi:hypothetical protein